MSVENLKSIADEIERELRICAEDLSRVGSLVIKTQSLLNLVAKEDPNSPEVKQLKGRAQAYHNKVKELSERRNRERAEFEQEMSDSKIRTRRITEMSDCSSDTHRTKFVATQTNKLDEFISSSMDSLESLRRQSIHIDRVNDVLKRGAIRLGVSNETLGRIESRFAGDKSLFIILLIGVAVLFLLLRFAF